MQPIAFLTFDRELVSARKTAGTWCISPSLRDHIDRQVPSPALSHLTKSARCIRVLQFLQARQPVVNVVL